MTQNITLTPGPDGGKANFIRDVLHEYRGLAREQLKEEPPSFEVSSRDRFSGNHRKDVDVVVELQGPPRPGIDQRQREAVGAGDIA